MSAATPQPQVRTALRGDLEACARLFATVQQEIEPRSPPWRAQDLIAETDGEEIWVAIVGTQVVGQLTLLRADAFVHFLQIAPAWRRRGIARRLMDAVRSDVDGPLELKCLAGNRAALRFYAATGWREVNRSMNPPAPYVRLRLDP